MVYAMYNVVDLTAVPCAMLRSVYYTDLCTAYHTLLLLVLHTIRHLIPSGYRYPMWALRSISYLTSASTLLPMWYTSLAPVLCTSTPGIWVHHIWCMRYGSQDHSTYSYRWYVRIPSIWTPHLRWYIWWVDLDIMPRTPLRRYPLKLTSVYLMLGSATGLWTTPLLMLPVLHTLRIMVLYHIPGYT